MTVDALHRWIMVLDVEDFSTRTNPPQKALREEMYRVLEESFTEAGLAAGPDLTVDDRGDGVLMVARPDLPPRVLAGPFVRALHDVLLERSHAIGTEHALRLRLSMHQGLASLDSRGWSGDAVNMAFRLVNADALRQVLRAAVGSPIVFGVSDTVFHDVIRHGYRSIDPAAYLPADFEVKHGIRTRAWITVPGCPAPPGLDVRDASADGDSGPDAAGAATHRPRPAPTPADARPAVAFHIGTVRGDAVAGDKYVGVRPPHRGEQ